MLSIFRYPGGKSREGITEWILRHKPREIGEYREPFVGGGGVFFALDPGKAASRWINDMNAGLIEVYRALVERPDDFIARCLEIEVAQPGEPEMDEGKRGGKKLNRRLWEKFEELKLNETVDQALRYFFINRTVFGGRVNYDIPSRLYFSNPEGWNIVTGSRLKDAREHMRGVKVTCGDFQQVFDEPGEDVWIYADPPYFRDTELTATSKLYQHSFTEADHQRLAEIVRDCKHKLCLSYDDTTEVRKLYPEEDGFRIREKEWVYCGTTKDERTTGRELLILNYDPPEEPSLFPVKSKRFLAPWQKSRLAIKEAIITRIVASFVELGEELTAIRDEGLYVEYGTFDDYCRSRWGLSRFYAYRIMDASLVVKSFMMLPIVNILPASEAQARELARIRTAGDRIDVDRAAEVWAQVVEHAQNDPRNITARVVRQHVDSAIGSPAPRVRRMSDLETVLARLAELTHAELLTVRDAIQTIVVQGGTTDATGISDGGPVGPS